MWRHAVSELKLHPGRYVATLVAIAVSVGFIAAISVFVNSQSNAMAQLSALPISKADVVVRGSDFLDEQTLEAVSRVEGVEEVAAPPATSGGFLSLGERSTQVQLYSVPAPWQRWAEATEGRMPEQADEIALSRWALSALDAQVGDRVDFEGTETQMRIVGATDDPRALFATTGYMFMPEDQGPAIELTVKLTPGASAEATAEAIETQVEPGSGTLTVLTGEQARAEQLSAFTGGFDVLKTMLQAFAAIALLVGAITIANTFTILAAQRRRQTGLLRAVGASPGQVQGRLMIEALLLGAVGSLAGIGLGFLVAWVGGFFTGSNHFGLSVAPLELVLAWLAGLVATFVAAVVPSLRASRTKPIEALQSVPTAADARRAGIVRAVVCALAALGGIGCVVLSRTDVDRGLFWAIGAGALLSVAVLGAARFYVAPLLRLGARMFGFTGPTTRLAFTNAARNPQRASATATALMLAVGLIVTLQVSLATTRTSGMEAIDEMYPTDIAVSFTDEMPTGFVDAMRTTAGVARVAEVPGKIVVSPRSEAGEAMVSLLSPAEAYADLGIEAGPTRVPDDAHVIASSYDDIIDGQQIAEGATFVLPGVEAPLTIKLSDNVEPGQFVVSPGTFRQVTGEAGTAQVWLRLTDRTDAGVLNQVVRAIDSFDGTYAGGGGAVMASAFTQLLDVMLIVMTALLGVAVLIALVGVANTLSLSVIERQRESALLRALGMQKSSLRLSLLIEAVAVVAIGTLIGLGAGMFFGWLGVSSVIAMMPVMADTVFSLDVGYTVGLIGACLVAAMLASILPGRRAANATPTEALAIE